MTILLEFEAIGTTWSIQLEIANETHQPELKTLLQAEITSVVDSYDKLYSRFRDDSSIAEIRHFTGSGNNSIEKSWHFPEHAQDLFSFYSKMEKITSGLFTASVGHSLEEIGYDATYSLGNKASSLTQNKNQHPSLRFNDLIVTYKDGVTLLTVPSQNDSTTQPLVLDFGAAGKGQLVDLISKTLDHHSAKPSTSIVNGSGDILHQGASVITVGLENPYNAKSVIGTVKIRNQALCGSAPNRRTWQVPNENHISSEQTTSTKYHHILNPETLQSPTHIAATWVIARTALEADGLATGLFLAPASVLQAAFDFEYLILYTTGKVEKSSGFIAELYV